MSRASTAYSNHEPGALSPARVLLTFAGLLLAMLLASLDQTIVSTALPMIVGELGRLDQLSWVVTAYVVGATATMPLWGQDRRPARPQGCCSRSRWSTFVVSSSLCGRRAGPSPS